MTPLNPKISFLFNAKIKKTTFEFIFHNRALFFSYLFSFRVSFSFVLVFFFQQWRMTWVASSDCITDFCQNWSFLKLWRFEYYEEFKIWFSLFSRVLLLAYFFLPYFLPVLFFSLFFCQQLLAIEKRLAILTGRQQISLKKKAYNATE